MKFISKYTKFCDVNEGLTHYLDDSSTNYSSSAGISQNSSFISMESKMNNDISTELNAPSDRIDQGEEFPY